MSLREDEIWVCDQLEKHFQPCFDSIEEGEDPPDIYLSITKNDQGNKAIRRIAVEISSLAEHTFTQEGNPENRQTQNIWGQRLIEEIHKKFSTKISKGLEVIIAIWVPVNDPSKYRKHLFEVLSQIMEKENSAGDFSEFSLLYSKGGREIKIQFGVQCKYRMRNIIGVILNRNSEKNIPFNVHYMLQSVIERKDVKCKNMPSSEEYWLVLQNKYPLAENGDYHIIFSEIKITHSFNKIFIISPVGEVIEISDY